jgi:rhamnose transport system permease protein
MKKQIKQFLRSELTLIIFLVLSIAAGIILSPNFLDLRFLMSSSALYAEFGLIAVCFTLLLTLGEIDLSVAANMTLVTCVIGALWRVQAPMGLAIFIGLATGCFCGFINAFLVTKTGLPSLIITIGTLSIFKGLSQVLVGEKAVGNFPAWFLGVDEKMVFGLFPLSVFIVIVAAIALEVVLKKTFFGRKIIAIGLNPNTAFYSGVNVNQMKLIIFSLLGLFCGIAGLLSISRIEVAKYSIGVGGEMDVVTMVLLGGTAFTGGRGKAIGTLVAYFILVFIGTGMRLATISNYTQIAVVGLLLIFIIVISRKTETVSVN